jgi:hypothetical protein
MLQQSSLIDLDSVFRESQVRSAAMTPPCLVLKDSSASLAGPSGTPE